MRLLRMSSAMRVKTVRELFAQEHGPLTRDAARSRAALREQSRHSLEARTSQTIASFPNDWIPKRTAVHHGRDFIAGWSVHRTAAVILPSVAWVLRRHARQEHCLICFLLRSRTSVLETGGSSVCNTSCGRSYAAIDFDPPQYDDDGRYERGQH
jgi:hypothetical protein